MPSGELRFCTLEYRPSQPSHKSNANGRLALLFVDDHQEALRVFVAPDLDENIHLDDLPYIDSLLKDFLERSGLDASALFQQVSSLAVGPIVTHFTGTIPADREYLKTHCSDFKRLEASAA